MDRNLGKGPSGVVWVGFGYFLPYAKLFDWPWGIIVDDCRESTM
jgi:hypothetical protein